MGKSCAFCNLWIHWSNTDLSNGHNAHRAWNPPRAAAMHGYEEVRPTMFRENPAGPTRLS